MREINRSEKNRREREVHPDGEKANELRTLQAKGGEEVRGTEEAIITHDVESDK